MFLENDFLLDIARGKVPGVSHIEKFGRNPDIDTNDTPEDVWDVGGLWVPPTSARIHAVASTSTQDKGSLIATGFISSLSRTELHDSDATFISDGISVGDSILNDTTKEHSMVLEVVSESQLIMHPTRHNKFFQIGDTYRIVTPLGTGASIIHVMGLGETMHSQDEWVITDGTTSVATDNPYWRVFRSHADGAADRNNSNVGDVSVTALVDGTVTAQINAGNGQTLMAIYTVPAGKRAYMVNTSGHVNRIGGSGTFADLAIREYPFAQYGFSGNRLQHYGSLATDGSSTYEKNFKPYKEFEAYTDIVMRVASVSHNNTDVSGDFSLILVDH